MMEPLFIKLTVANEYIGDAVNFRKLAKLLGIFALYVVVALILTALSRIEFPGTGRLLATEGEKTILIWSVLTPLTLVLIGTITFMVVSGLQALYVWLWDIPSPPGDDM